ncbi:2-C-methyl-D-erythritol 4-phosphate cytidylyltransferase [Pedobacter antarcticus]|uniref:2-C-methyl-D-erythritol 4-phosphate cytidylyltransferase n=1 Tax=Pedobacter antarcticus TaxID=34086 RepID=UPI001C59B52F|nr:2-C-methyl-D-erythritol 4-phosphate cytidylyltransferase [Pedobacter antarcticus]
MKYIAIIVAGGKGSRMNHAVPKQFLELQGKPVLMHTLEAFANCALKPEIILVLNIHQHEFWEELCRKYEFTIAHQLVKGGAERFDSVKNGLKKIKGDGVVAIHDAVRPLVSPELIENAFRAAELEGNAITALQAVDSVRIQIEGQHATPLNRNEIFLVQTPQAFQLKQLKKAYLQPYRIDFTDDASVVEKAGYPIHLLPGERTNIKITYTEDLQLADWFLQTKKTAD